MVKTWTTYLFLLKFNFFFFNLFLLSFFYLYAVLILHKSILSCSLCYLGLFESRLICTDDGA